ncbi:MAG: KTSC domain-containing protein [Pedobacter sp.]|nr:MAG: KTSC domain-containing protein [Pedobacter sp.]
MKKIVDYRKLLEVTEEASLQDLKSVYRGMMKKWHPDKFAGDEVALEEAEGMSRSVIEAYHFLVSIAKETREETFADYEITVSTSQIADFEFKNQVLTIDFTDGNSYEYFDVPKSAYVKLINADSPARFARRHIYQNYVYRSKAVLVAS